MANTTKIDNNGANLQSILDKDTNGEFNIAKSDIANIKNGTVSVGKAKTYDITATEENSIKTKFDTKEDILNKSTSITTDGTSDIKYPSVKAVKTYADTKQSSLGFTPENISNKITSISGASTDIQYPSAKLLYDQLLTKQSLNEKNQPNGYAGLDQGGKVPLQQLPSTLLLYQGVWNATTNDPQLTNPDTSKVGYVYTVGTAGTQFDIVWNLGDWLIYNSDGVPEKSENSDDVTSVNGQQGVVVLDYSDVGAEPAKGEDDNYVTDAEKVIIGNTSGTNSGDETADTIKTKLGITTLSGSNTGDETVTTIKSKLGISTLSGSNTGDETASSIKTKLGITTLSGDNTGDQFVPTKTSELTNDSGFITNSSIPDISGKQDISNLSNNITTDAASETKYPSVKAIKDYVDTTQPSGNYELLSNKTTILASTSTNTQYPTAKAVYDNLPKIIEFDGNRYTPTDFWSQDENGFYLDDDGNWVMTIDENGQLVWKELNTDNTNNETILNKVTSISSESTDIEYPSAKLLYDQLATKQPSGSYELTTNKDISGGYCSLDAGGKVPLNKLPSTLLLYQSTWNASTNIPNLTTPDLTKVGYVYTVNGVGNRFGIDWKLGDWLIYNSSGIPEKSDNSDDVTSVNGQQGAVNLTAANVGAEPTLSAQSTSPTSYYFRGDKSWQLFSTPVRATTLAGLNITNVAITSSDSLLVGAGKSQGQINDLKLNKVDKVSGKSLIDDTAITRLANTSGTNTGDETETTIKTKLGISTLSFDSGKFIPIQFWSKSGEVYSKDPNGTWVISIDNSGNLVWINMAEIPQILTDETTGTKYTLKVNNGVLGVNPL